MACIWKNIYEQEKLHLQNGQFRRGDNFLSASDLARNYGVNYLTARRALNELAAERFLTKTAAGEFQTTGIGQQAKIYFLAPGAAFTQHTTSSSWMLVQQGVFEEALRFKQQILPISFNECLKLPTEPATLLFISGSTRFSDEVFLKFLPSNVYPIAINACHKSLFGAAIGSDNTQMMYDLTCSFIERGKKKIGYIGDTAEGRMYERFEGFYQALTAHNIEFMPNWAYTLWLVSHKNIIEIAAWIERENLEVICAPSIDDIDFLEQNLAPNIFNKVLWGAIGKPNAIQPDYSYVQPDYIGEGNLAVKVALEIDPLAVNPPKYYKVSAQLHTI